MRFLRSPRTLIARGAIGLISRHSSLLGKLMWYFAFRKLIGDEARLIAYRALGAVIGDEVYIGARTMIRSPKNVTIGDGSRIEVAKIEAWGPVTIGSDVMINYEIDSPSFAGDTRSIEIGDHAWLPHHIRVLPGVRIGHCAVIGTGSVVTRDVPDYGVAVGSPARVVKERARVEYTYRASRA
jgi:acetyltransferase-like isoleucine patch superfamily enzyme